MVLSLVFAGFDGQLLGQGFLPDQRWSGVKRGELDRSEGSGRYLRHCQSGSVFRDHEKTLLLARNRQGSWNWFWLWGQGPERDSRSVYSCELGFFIKASQVERAPWKSYLTHMLLTVACVRERFKELVHEHCVTFGTRKDLWMLLLDFALMSTSPEFTCQIPYNENTGLERYMSYVANLGTRFDLMLSPHHHGGHTKRAKFHPAHAYLHIPDCINLRMG